MLSGKVTINGTLKAEYGMVYDNLDGSWDIYHMHKNPALLSQFVRDRLNITTTPFSSTTYYAENNPNYQNNVGIVIVLPDVTEAGLSRLWYANTWQEVIIDAPQRFQGQKTAAPYNRRGRDMWPMMNVDSFVKFMLAAFPTDAARFDQHDPGNLILKRTCELHRYEN